MRNKGFTLIELLIVIIIVGILAAIILPQIGNMTEKARTSEAKTALAVLRKVLMLKHTEDGTFPTADAADINEIEAVLGEIIDENRSLFTYSWTAGDTSQIIVTADRDTTKDFSDKGTRSQLVMTIRSSGSADLELNWVNTGIFMIDPPDAGTN